MAARPPTHVTAEQERRAWDLRQKCWTERRIADELNIAESTVSRMLARVNKRLAKSFEDRAAEIKAEQTAQLEYIAEEAMRQWEASEGEIVVRRESVKREAVYGEDKKPRVLRDTDGGVIRTGDGQPVAEMVEVERTDSAEYRQQLGDPRYLGEARAAKADIRKIWGLDAQKDGEMNVNVQKAYINVPVDDV